MLRFSLFLLAAVTLVQGGCATRAGRNAVTIPADTDSRWMPIASTPGAFRLDLSGAPDREGAFSYLLKLTVATEVPAHVHSVALRASLQRGTQVILMGDPAGAVDTVRLQPGGSFPIPPGVVHREAFTAGSVVHLTGVGPVKTERR